MNEWPTTSTRLPASYRKDDIYICCCDKCHVSVLYEPFDEGNSGIKYIYKKNIIVLGNFFNRSEQSKDDFIIELFHGKKCRVFTIPEPPIYIGRRKMEAYVEKELNEIFSANANAICK